jgi:ABC-type uncharacterized transport system substrate-binding protein
MNFSVLLCLFFISLCPATIALAHPHVFVDYSLSFVFNENGFAGVEQHWVFDEMFTSTVLYEFDRDQNLSLDEKEITEIKEKYFSSLKDFAYFTHIKIDGKDFEVRYVKDFFAGIQEDKLVYRFFVPCHVSATSNFKEILVSIYDDTYYTDMASASDTLSFQGREDRHQIEYSIGEKNECAYYYEMIIPQTITLKFKQR